METPEVLAKYFDRLWPLLRSITGEGVRRTHDILSELIPLDRLEVPSGTVAFDWTVPREWVVRDAYVIAPDGRRMLDVHEHTLRLVNYSVGFRGRLSRAELQAHLHSLPELPDAIPYVTSYYAPRWGFCLTERERAALPEGTYEVVVDAEHVNGSLTIGEAVLPGEEPDEVLLSTYTCHPSLANNELSGPLVTALLYQRLAAWPRRRLTYRFVYLPETIGSLVYLSQRGEHLRRRLVAGYVVTCVGMAGRFTYKRSRRGASLADRAAEHVLKTTPGVDALVLDFFPDRGSDERQYCSPGFDLPVGSLMRAMYGSYPEYHTSLDDRRLLSFEAMAETIDVYAAILRVLDASARYRNLIPHGEPQLGRRGLYPTLGTRGGTAWTSAIMWLLNFSDGHHDLLTIAEKSGHDMVLLESAARQCEGAGLLERVPRSAD